MRKEWTIDSCILHAASQTEFDAIKLLMQVHETCAVALDCEGEILKQYETCIREARAEKRPSLSIVEEWIKGLSKRRGAVVTHSGSLSNLETRQLDSLEFDTDDRVYVGVSKRTNIKIIVSVDSDYSSQVRDHLRQALGIEIYNARQAKQYP